MFTIFLGFSSLSGRRGGLNIKLGFYHTSLLYVNNGGDTPLYSSIKT